jgi:hypothetical protein
MRLFGKKIFAKKPLTAEEQEKRQAKERLSNIKRIQRIEKEQQRKVQAQADADRRYQQEQQRLNRQGNIESARTRIARERAARAAAQERKYGGYRGTIESAASVFGIKSKRRDSGSRQRPIYVSTSHGLRKISADDPDYYKYREQQGQVTPPPSVKRIVVKENSEDNEQPSAFSGW